MRSFSILLNTLQSKFIYFCSYSTNMAASGTVSIEPLDNFGNEKVKQLTKSNDTKLDSVKEPARTILEQYSKIPPEQILGHVKRVVCLKPT